MNFNKGLVFLKRGISSTAATSVVPSESAKTVAFIGCGNMGGFMAQNLLKSGLNVRAFDMSEKVLDRMQEFGAKKTKSPADAAESADYVITMLPANQHVKDAYLGKNGIQDSAKKGTLCIDSSTVDPSVSREVAKVLDGKGIRFVDAPVSGGVGGAEKGTLTFMVGGNPESFLLSKPLLSFMGKNIVHCGDVGSGEIVKLCNNMVLAVSMIGIAESMNMGVKLGMDRKQLASILNTSTARCWSSDTYNPCPGVMEGVPSSRDYSGGFGSSLMLKDLGLAMDAARSAKAPVPLGEASHALYQLLCSNGLGDKDFSVVYKFLGGK